MFSLIYLIDKFLTYAQQTYTIILSAFKSGTTDRPPNFDELPAELKMKIIQPCDYKTLRSVVHASPGFHSFYLSAREELLALVTIRQLNERGFNFFGRYNIIEAGGQDKSIQKAAKTLYDQCQLHVSTNFKHIIRLDVPSCIVLLKVKHAIGWRLERVEGQRQAKLKRQKKFPEGLQRRDDLRYVAALLSSVDEPGWEGLYMDMMFQVMMRRHHTSGKLRPPYMDG